MKRFIDIGKQIAVDESDPDEPRQFSFFDTIVSLFEKFDGEQVWDSWEEFERAYNSHYEDRDSLSLEDKRYVERELKRYKGLCHSWAFSKEPIAKGR